MQVGEKVIVRCSEWNESFKIGVLVGYNDIGGTAKKPLPQVEIEGKEYIIFGCDSELAEELRALTP